MKAKNHPGEKPRGVRSSFPPSCQVQAGGRLAWIENGQPMFWTDRPRKFPAHIRVRLRRPGVTITDIKWKQLNGKAWWRLPEFPDGTART